MPSTPIALSSGHEVVAIHESSIGTQSATMQTPMNVLKVALLTGARDLIIAHNHPSGRPEPSQEDLVMTSAVLKATQCVGLTLLDALVVALDGWSSLIHEGVVGFGGAGRWPR